jgi:hypothetical protein
MYQVAYDKTACEHETGSCDNAGKGPVKGKAFLFSELMPAK